MHKAREEEEKRKVQAKEEKERKRKRRKKLVELIKAKKEGNHPFYEDCITECFIAARRKRLHEDTLHQAEEHKKQADQHEKMWREKTEHEVVAWREKIHREQQHWQEHIHHQMEKCHNDHQKQMDNLLHNSYLPKCAKSCSAAKPVVSLSTKCSTGATQHSKKSGPRKKGVHFQQTASIHIIEEDETDLEDNAEPVDSREPGKSVEMEMKGKAKDEVKKTRDDENKVLDGSSEDVSVESLGGGVSTVEEEGAVRDGLPLENVGDIASSLTDMAIQDAKNKLDNE